jgi:hypothetical protein
MFVGSRLGSDRSDEIRKEVARNVTGLTWRATSIEPPARDRHDRTKRQSERPNESWRHAGDRRRT